MRRATLRRVSAMTRWPSPSPPAADLIRAVAERLLAAPQGLFDEVDAAVARAGTPEAAADPAIQSVMRQANHGNLLHWARANLRAPGEPVPANVSPETLDVVRDLVRRGFEDFSESGYRVGQGVAWRRWMDAAFELSRDPAVLREALDVTAASMAAFVDGTLAGVRTEFEREREQLERGLQAQRMQTVLLILDGAPIDPGRASLGLRYELAREHTACILWHEAGVGEHGALERAAEEIGRAAGARRPLTVTAGSASLWAWLASDAEGVDLTALDRADLGPGAVRVAVGNTAAGIAGFRRSHLDALVVQRLMERLPAERRLVRHADVGPVALLARDPAEAADFVARTLGELAYAPEELRETLRVYVREGCGVTRCARATFAHRNTVLARLTRARELLPAPLDGRALEVGLALEIVHWLGARG